MTKIHLQAAARLQRELDELENNVGVLKQAGWMPIPKPLTQEQIEDLADLTLDHQERSYEDTRVYELIRAVERHHGIGEKK